MRSLRAVLVVWTLAFGLHAAESGAVTITTDYSSLGTVKLDGNGAVSGSGTDVTADFKQVVDTAAAYWESAVTKAWNVSIGFEFKSNESCGSFTATQWVGCAIVGTTASTAPKHITSGTIWFNSNSTAAFEYFVDSTPNDDSEFDLTNGTASLGGGNVNNRRRGDATTTGGATGRWDVLTLALHEIEHLLGFSGVEIYQNAVDTDHITIEKALSGLTNDFDVPVVSETDAHIDAGTGTTFDHTVVAAGTGEWESGERARITGIDALAVCQINQCTNTEVNTNPVPEPGTAVLVTLGMLGLAFAGRPRPRAG